MGCDISSNIPTVHKILCDGEFLPFHDNMFDLVTSNLRSVKLCILGYRIAGNFRREIFSEISEMLYTFRKFISEKLLCFYWQ